MSCRRRRLVLSTPVEPSDRGRPVALRDGAEPHSSKRLALLVVSSCHGCTGLHGASIVGDGSDLSPCSQIMSVASDGSLLRRQVRRSTGSPRRKAGLRPPRPTTCPAGLVRRMGLTASRQQPPQRSGAGHPAADAFTSRLLSRSAFLHQVHARASAIEMSSASPVVMAKSSSASLAYSLRYLQQFPHRGNRARAFVYAQT